MGPKRELSLEQNGATRVGERMNVGSKGEYNFGENL
jgi:hypothetical protein